MTPTVKIATIAILQNAVVAMLNKNTWGTKKLQSQSEAAVNDYRQPCKTLISS